MALAPVATVAACGSILTAVKSGWELSRMIKKKDLEKRLDKEAKVVVRDLQNAYLDGLMSERSFEKWYDRVVGALAEKDGMELRKVKQHVDLVRSSKERITRGNTRANRNSSYYYDEKQPHHHHHQHHSHHRRPHSVDRYSEYTRYEEKGRRPRFDHGSHHNPHLGINTDKAQRDYYYSHALPSPYRGEIEYTPLDAEFDDARSSHAGSERSRRGRGGAHHHHHHHHHGGGGGGSSSSRNRKAVAAEEEEEFVSRSSSVDHRGRTRSRSVHLERRVRDSSADADSEAEEVYERREPKGMKDRGLRRVMIGDEVRLVPRVVPTEVELMESGGGDGSTLREMDEMLDLAIAIGDFGEGIGAVGEICEIIGAFGDMDL
ncbi:hypothetical protein DHEL01_v205096 [Diaporthe helianthi]|uniref:Uncharacterized protein n=1 Tax=Diaporthe helianthi TaxID=158607 RepID=A0A2P5I1V8_DIAHE|nr:hypothetical protein DHEL01_v205096 [Diaporthe helianthi]